jgi:hypothetical protein
MYGVKDSFFRFKAHCFPLFIRPIKMSGKSLYHDAHMRPGSWKIKVKPTTAPL